MKKFLLRMVMMWWGGSSMSMGNNPGNNDVCGNTTRTGEITTTPT
jgi:hypothetical protein